MCALKSRGMSAVCTWGLRGILFLTLVLFVLISHGAVRCFVAGLFPTMYRTISKTLHFMLKYKLRAYAYGTYDHLPCAKAKKQVLVPRRIVR
jgi:hypothetical protein